MNGLAVMAMAVLGDQRLLLTEPVRHLATVTRALDLAVEVIAGLSIGGLRLPGLVGGSRRHVENLDKI